MFVSDHMLAVMAAIARAEDGMFSTPALVDATGLPVSTVHALLTRLKRGHFVRRSRVDADRVAIYERAIHPTWEFALYLEAEADAIAAGTFKPVWATEQVTA